MAQDIINRESISQQQILENINSFINTLPNANEIKDRLNTSTMSMITQLLAGVGSWQYYYFNVSRRETYLSTATKETSIYNIARMFGYNIRRAKAPGVMLQYDLVPTVVLNTGTVLGKYNDKDLVYFGEPRIIEKGDKIPVYCGSFKSVSGTVDLSSKKYLYITVKAQTLKYIDDSLLRLTAKDRVYNLTKDVESYIVFKEPVDYSLAANETAIYVRDQEYNYGIEGLITGNTYKLEYLETDGYDPNMSLKGVEAETGYLPYEVITVGTTAESAEKIKSIAPLYYSTLRRAVTEKDYNYLSKSHSLIEDCKIYKENGVPGEWVISIQDDHSIITGESFTINIQDETAYLTKAIEGDTKDAILRRLSTVANRGGWVECSVKESKLYMKNKDTRVALDVVCSSQFNEVEEKTKQVNPPCCTLTLYYIRQGQTREGDIIIFTEQEKKEYAQFLTEFKMTGTTIILQPAVRIQYDISLIVTLHDPTIVTSTGKTILEYFIEKARQILRDTYEFKVQEKFNYYDYIALITQIEYDDGVKNIQIVKAIVPNQSDLYPLKDIELNYDEYLVVPNLNIKFTGTEGNQDGTEQVK